MDNLYLFRKIKKEEIPQMFSMIRQRMAWMDEKGIEPIMRRLDLKRPAAVRKEHIMGF